MKLNGSLDSLKGHLDSDESQKKRRGSTQAPTFSSDAQGKRRGSTYAHSPSVDSLKMQLGSDESQKKRRGSTYAHSPSIDSLKVHLGSDESQKKRRGSTYAHSPSADCLKVHLGSDESQKKRRGSTYAHSPSCGSFREGQQGISPSENAPDILEDPWRPSERLTWGTSVMLQMGLQFSVRELPECAAPSNSLQTAPCNSRTDEKMSSVIAQEIRRHEELEARIEDKERRVQLKKAWLAEQHQRESGALRSAMLQTLVSLASVQFWKLLEINRVCHLLSSLRNVFSQHLQHAPWCALPDDANDCLPSPGSA